MLSEETQERLAEKLVDRIEELNTTILEEIGKAIKQIGTLSPSQAYKLAQTLKYGGSSKKIIKKLAEITKLNQKDIRKILADVAKSNLEFSKPFFQYRGIDFIPYEENKALQNQVNAIAKLTNDKYLNFMNTSAFKINIGGKDRFTPISKIYQKTVDKAVLAIVQGKESYQSTMRKTMRELAENGIICIDDDGIKKVSYANGYKRRLDSSVRMNILDGMRQVTNEMQEELGKTFGADGVEISVHENPAPDHKDVQGRQFSTAKTSEDDESEWEKLQSGKEAIDYNGVKHTLDHDNKNGFRPISTMNCYHYVFSVILGVNKPQYSEEQLQKINERNEKGFNFENKHYTMYEGTQLQRAIETKIRTLKDRQIIARASGNREEVGYCQKNIGVLTKKYNELCKTSGLEPKKTRLSVSGYHPIKVAEIEMPKYDFSKYREIIDNTKLSNLDEKFDYNNFIKEYDKFYNSIDKAEIKQVSDNYQKYLINSADGAKESNPYGDFLNKKFNYDAKPELIDEKEFWKDENGEEVRFGDTYLLDRNHWYRGITVKDEKTGGMEVDVEKTKKYVSDFKNGDYFAGIGINGNGTYVTESFSYADNFASNFDDGIIYLMPKDNAKTVDIDKILHVRSKLAKYINNDDNMYIDFLNDPGYLAEILGYDIVYIGEHRIVLNRGAIKVVK